MKFERITKKKFVEDMTSSSVIFVQGGFTSLTIDNSAWCDKIIEYCEEICIDTEEQCKCIAHSNSLERKIPNGESSWIYFDQKCKRFFYEYGNIRIMEQVYNESERRNYLIYLCV
jgi:hypothetical protein